MNKNCFAPLAFAQSATGLSHQDQKLTLVLCKKEGVRTRLNTKHWQIGILVYYQSLRTIMDTKSLFSHTLSCSTFVTRFSRFVCNRQRERGVVCHQIFQICVQQTKGGRSGNRAPPRARSLQNVNCGEDEMEKEREQHT
jgi:hypothetical protein